MGQLSRNPLVETLQYNCKLCDKLATVDAEDAATLETVLNGTHSHAAIARWMTENGHPIGETTVGRHRREHG